MKDFHHVQLTQRNIINILPPKPQTPKPPFFHPSKVAACKCFLRKQCPRLWTWRREACEKVVPFWDVTLTQLDKPSEKISVRCSCSICFLVQEVDLRCLWRSMKIIPENYDSNFVSVPDDWYYYKIRIISVMVMVRLIVEAFWRAEHSNQDVLAVQLWM